jgi:hypothetical protein
MLIIAALVALFAAQTPITAPAAKPETTALEAQANQEAQPKCH